MYKGFMLVKYLGAQEKKKQFRWLTLAPHGNK